MCGRYVLRKYSPELFQEMLDVEFSESNRQVGSPDYEELFRDRFNMAPTQTAPVVVLEGASKHLRPMRWGLIPGWAKDDSMGARCINARSETIREKPAFRSAFKKRRCLIPADGYYEWKPLTKSKQPYYIHRSDAKLLTLAGLWESWTDPASGEVVQSYCAITCPSKGIAAEVHDRMPVVLERSDWQLWLDPSVADLDALERLLVPANEGVLAGYAVPSAVGNVRNQGPQLIEPLAGLPKLGEKAPAKPETPSLGF